MMGRLDPLAALGLVAVVACGSAPAPPQVPMTTVSIPSASASTSAVEIAPIAPPSGAPEVDEDAGPHDHEELGQLSSGHGASATLRAGTTIVENGGARLSVDIINRVVRQNFGRFRVCYEAGLRKDPTLAGKLVMRFHIDATGAVSSAVVFSSSLNDHDVKSCVYNGFSNFVFPAPTGSGGVFVRYTIIFAPPGAP